MSDPVFLFIFATVTFLLAGTIKGAIGIGMPTAAIGMLSQIIEPKTAIALVVLPTFVSNAWQMFRSGEIVRACKDYWIFIVVMMVVLWATTFITGAASQETLLLIIGFVVVAFSLTSLFLSPPRLPTRFDNAAQAVLGTVAGVLGGLTAVWAAPIVIYLVSRRTEKEEFIRATGLLITFGSIPLVLGFWRNGIFSQDTATLSAFLILPALLGFRLGEMIRARLPVNGFATTVQVLFLLMGLNIIRRALF